MSAALNGSSSCVVGLLASLLFLSEGFFEWVSSRTCDLSREHATTSNINLSSDKSHFLTLGKHDSIVILFP